MLVLGIETSCDETGVALYDEARGLLAEALHSQTALHDLYGGVVPELASRDHIRRLVPLTRLVLQRAGCVLTDVDAYAYTAGPGLAGALLTGAAYASALACAHGRPAIPIHHLEGHLLSPLLSADRPAFPFVALLVSGGHTQLMRVDGVGRYQLIGETLDDAAGEAFDKTAKLLGLGYPGGPALARLAAQGTPGRCSLPRPMLHTPDLNFSFSGLKTAVASRLRDGGAGIAADLAAEFQEAVVEVLVSKCLAAIRQTGLDSLVVAGGVGANSRLRAALLSEAGKRRIRVHFPELALCTDNGAMIALTAALRLSGGQAVSGTTAFSIRPRWPLAELSPPADGRA
ncbi:MAG: tRNA N6-adenosine threonylcarbamoyltransferase [Betaproteobacteria bacterium]|jgi:N6-L-threonylcarbamoyladenine synthase